MMTVKYVNVSLMDQIISLDLNMAVRCV